MRALSLLGVVAAMGCGDDGFQTDGEGEAEAESEAEAEAESEAEAEAEAESEAEAEGPPIDEIDDLALVVVIGDSLAAGYNSDGRNGDGGHGWARLVYENHPDWPDYGEHDLSTPFPGAQFRDISESGAQSGDALDRVQGADLPEVAGDVVVLISVGGNDFNDEVATIISMSATEDAAANLRANLAGIYAEMRDRYEDPAAGQAVVFIETNVHDPTDGEGTIPASFNDGFCELINNPVFTDELRAQALMNLDYFNGELAAEVEEQGGWLADIYAGFIGHGMNSGSDRWIDDDCVHPTNPGHDLIRRLAWETLTGETY